MLAKKVAVDLGHTRTRVFVKGAGLVVDQTTPPDAPFQNGRVSDSKRLDAYVKRILGRAIGWQRLFKPEVILTVMSSMPDDDRRNLLASVMRTGVRAAYLLDVPVVAAMGCGLVVDEQHSALIVDIGGGKTDIGVVSADGILASECVEKGSDEITSEELADRTQAVLGDTPTGIVMQIRAGRAAITGGGANRTNLRSYLGENLGINWCEVVDPELATIRGGALALDNFAGLKQSRAFLLRASHLH